MNARSALLVAVVAVLAGGALWLVRGIEGRSRRPSSTVHRTESAPEGTTPSAAQPTLTPTPRPVKSARATIATNESEDAAPDSDTKPTLVQILVLRQRTTAADVVVPNARVEIVETGSEDDRPRWDVKTKGETDERGLFSFEAPRSFAATIRVEATIDGRKFFGVSCPILPSVPIAPFVVRLNEEPPRELHIAVIDRDTLLPIIGAEVRPSGAEPTTTNTLGEFAVWVEDVSYATEVRAWIGADGYFPLTWHSWQAVQRSLPTRRSDAFSRHANAPTTTDRPVVYMRRAARLWGSLADAAGARVEGAELRTHVQQSGDSAYVARAEIALTDDRGRFEFKALPAGLALQFEVRLRGESVECDVPPIRLDPGEARELTLRMRGHVELTGRVLDVNDALVRGGTISIAVDGESDTGTIRSDGTYYLPFAFAGAGWITVFPEAEQGQHVTPERVPIVIPVTVKEWTFDVRLVPASSVAGVFQDHDGQPVRPAQLFLRGEATPTFEAHVFIFNERGEFLFDSVPPGEYTLTGLERSGAQRSAHMVVHSGDQRVVLHLPEQGRLRGRVVDASGEAVAQAVVHVQPEGAAEFTIVCERDGSFRQPASTGPVWVWAEGGHGSSRYERVSVEAGSETAVRDLVVVPAANLVLVTGRLVQRVHVDLSDDAGPYLALDVEPLSERWIRVPVGAVSLVATCAGHEATTRSLFVRRDEVVNVPLSCGP